MYVKKDRSMPPYSYKKQVRVVVATCALHNYVRLNADVQEIEEMDNLNPSPRLSENFGNMLAGLEGVPLSRAEGVEEMLWLREQIIDSIMTSL